MKARILDTIGFAAGIILLVIPILYIIDYSLGRAGLPTFAQASSGTMAKAA